MDRTVGRMHPTLTSGLRQSGATGRMCGPGGWAATSSEVSSQVCTDVAFPREASGSLDQRVPGEPGYSRAPSFLPCEPVGSNITEGVTGFWIQQTWGSMASFVTHRWFNFGQVMHVSGFTP